MSKPVTRDTQRQNNSLPGDVGNETATSVGAAAPTYPQKAWPHRVHNLLMGQDSDRHVQRGMAPVSQDCIIMRDSVIDHRDIVVIA